jgi:hypothetical protein
MSISNFAGYAKYLVDSYKTKGLARLQAILGEGKTLDINSFEGQDTHTGGGYKVSPA